MKKLLLVSFLFAFGILYGQDSTHRWQAHLSVGQYPANLFVPIFQPFHPGVQTGLNYTLNKHPRHRFSQSVNLAYFAHQNVQHAVQLFTEFGYGIHLNSGLIIRPFTFGGGYVMGLTDTQSFIWDESSQSYQSAGADVNHNWLISLGLGLDYRTKLNLLNQPLTFTIDYRTQVQGTFVRENAPLIAYAPMRIGVSIPVRFKN